MHRRLTLALTLATSLPAATAAAESVLVLDDTTPGREAVDAATLLGLTSVDTRNIAGFQAAIDAQPEWELVVVDAARLSVGAPLLDPLRTLIEAGTPVLVSNGNLDGNAAFADLLGLSCTRDPSSLSIFSTPDGDADIFHFVEDVPDPAIGSAVYPDNGDVCTPVGDGLILARFGAIDGPPAVLTGLGNQIMYSGLVFDSLRAGTSGTDADGDGTSDLVELIANEMAVLLDLQTSALIVYADGDAPAIDRWATELELDVLRPADPAELDALAADDTYYAAVFSLRDLASADADLLASIDALRASGTPVLVFSPDFDGAPDWAAHFGVTVADTGDTAAAVSAGPAGLERALFTQPYALPSLAVGADAAGDSGDAFSATGGLQIVARFGDASGDAAALADLAGGLVIAGFDPSELTDADSDADGLSDTTEFLDNARAFAATIAPVAIVVSDAADAGVPSLMSEAASDAGLYPLLVATPADAEGALGTTAASVVLVESYGAVPGAFDDAAFVAALDAWISADGAVIVAAVDLDDSPALAGLLGVTPTTELTSPRNVVRDTANLGRVFSLPHRTPSTLAAATLDLDDLGDTLELAELGAVVARFPDTSAAIVTTHNGKVMTNGFALASVGQTDSDVDRSMDVLQLLAGELLAVTDPQRSLVLDTDTSAPSLFAIAAQRAGLRAELVRTPAEFVAAFDAGGMQQIAIDSSLDDALVDPEVWTRLMAWVAETRSTTLAFPNFDEYPEAAAAFGFSAVDTATIEPLVESNGDESQIFRSPSLVPYPVQRTGAIYADHGDTLTITGDAQVAARFRFNIGPAAAVLAASGTAAVNAFCPREVADEDLNLDGVEDRVALFTNQMVRTGRVPVTVLGGPYSLDEGTTLALDASGSFDPFGETLSFAWDLDGDGDFDDATGAIATLDGRNLDGPSVKDVAVQVTNESRLRSVTRFTVPVANVAPTVSAGGNLTVNQGVAAAFNASVADVRDDTFLVEWDFGDGDTAVGPAQTHLYDTLGVYTVVVVVTDDDGGVTTATFDVTYQNVAPAIEIGTYAAFDEGGQLDVTAVVSDPGGDAFSVTWDFGDGGTGDGLTASHVYPDNGTFSLVATATDENGGIATDRATIQVRNVAPTVTSTPVTSVVAGTAYVYDATATDPGADTLVWTLVSGPAGMTVDAEGHVRWTPPPTGFDDVNVRISVADGDGGTATQNWTINIGFADSDSGGAPDVCELAFGFDSTDAADDATDPDEDGLTVAEECLAGSDPTVFSGPPAPTLVSPIDLATWNRAFVSLVVENVDDPDGDTVTYDFQLYAEGDLSGLVAELVGVAEDTAGNTTGLFESISLDEDHVYWWRARAVATDVTGPWSLATPFVFNQRNSPPTRPNALSPIDFAATRTPTLIVENALDPEFETLTYEFEIFRGITARADLRVAGETGLAEGDDGQTLWTVPVELEEGAQYTWRARARDGSGSVGPYEVVSFVVDEVNTTPPTPEIVSPTEESEVQPVSSVELRWRNVEDEDNDPVSYLGDFGTDPDFATIDRSFRIEQAPGASTTSVTIPINLEPSTTYYWRVAATDGRNTSAYAAASFTTPELFVNQPPGAPTPVAPGAGATFDVNEPVELIVDNAVDANGDVLVYEFQVAIDVDMRNLAETWEDVDETTDTTSVTYDPPGATSYFWRARAYDGVDYSPWTQPRGFRVQAVTTPDADPDAGSDVSEGDGDDAAPMGATSGTLGGGAGCAAAPVSGGSAAWTLAVVLGLVVARRRRR